VTNLRWIHRRRESRRPILLLALTAACVLGFRPALVRGQEADELIEEDAPLQPQFKYLVEGGFVGQGDADIDRGGTVQVARFDLGLASRTDLFDRLHWGNTFFFGVHDYDFDGGGFSLGNPWETILQMRLGTKLTYDFNQQWGMFVGGILMFSPETSASWGDSVTGGGMVGVQYRHSETLFTSLGVAVVTQLEDDPKVTPSVGLNWVPGGGPWKVRIGSVPASGGTVAAGEVAYRIFEPLEVGLGALYNERRFRLNDSGPARNGVGEDNNLPVRVRVGWNINPNFSLQFLGGVAFGGELTLDDSRGRTLRSSDYDPAAYAGMRVVGAF
jgi:hypothetical protein